MNGAQGGAKGGVQIRTKGRIITDQPGTGWVEEEVGVEGQAEKE